MKKLVKLALIAALAVTSVTAADLYTGSVGKNYHDVVGPSLANNAKPVLKSVPGTGSVGNMDTIIGTPDYALAQANVYEPLVESNDKYSTLDVIGSVGMECAFPVVPVIDRNGRSVPSPLTSLAGEKITVGAKTSGDNYSFNQLAEINPTLAAMKPVYRATSKRHIGKVANGYQGAAFFFSVPDKNNPYIKEVLNNPKVTFADAEEINLGELGKGKRPALFKQELTLAGTTFTAVCTNINVIADTEHIVPSEADIVYEATKKTRTEALTASGMLSDAKIKALDAASKAANFIGGLFK